jgi:hypothetical protein
MKSFRFEISFRVLSLTITITILLYLFEIKITIDNIFACQKSFNQTICSTSTDWLKLVLNTKIQDGNQAARSDFGMRWKLKEHLSQHHPCQISGG